MRLKGLFLEYRRHTIECVRNQLWESAKLMNQRSKNIKVLSHLGLLFTSIEHWSFSRLKLEARSKKHRLENFVQLIHQRKLLWVRNCLDSLRANKDAFESQVGTELLAVKKLDLAFGSKTKSLLLSGFGALKSRRALALKLIRAILLAHGEYAQKRKEFWEVLKLKSKKGQAGERTRMIRKFRVMEDIFSKSKQKAF